MFLLFLSILCSFLTCIYYSGTDKYLAPVSLRRKHFISFVASVYEENTEIGQITLATKRLQHRIGHIKRNYIHLLHEPFIIYRERVGYTVAIKTCEFKPVALESRLLKWNTSTVTSEFPRRSKNKWRKEKFHSIFCLGFFPYLLFIGNLKQD